MNKKIIYNLVEFIIGCIMLFSLGILAFSSYNRYRFHQIISENKTVKTSIINELDLILNKELTQEFNKNPLSFNIEKKYSILNDRQEYKNSCSESIKLNQEEINNLKGFQYSFEELCIDSNGVYAPKDISKNRKKSAVVNQINQLLKYNSEKDIPLSYKNGWNH